MDECDFPILHSFYAHDRLPDENKISFNFINFTVSSGPFRQFLYSSYMNGLKIIQRYYKDTERL
jgi:hypothetical protein